MSDLRTALEPPCDCIKQLEDGNWYQECYCQNNGDLAASQAWCTEQNIMARMALEAPAMLDALRVTFQFIEDHALDAFNEVVGETMNAAGNPADRIRAILAKFDGGAE